MAIGALNGAKQSTAMESKVTAIERAFQLARSGQMATVDDIRKRLKQEGYDERVMLDGGRSLTAQLRGLIKTAATNAQLLKKARRREGSLHISGSDSFLHSWETWSATPD